MRGMAACPWVVPGAQPLWVWLVQRRIAPAAGLGRPLRDWSGVGCGADRPIHGRRICHGTPSWTIRISENHRGGTYNTCSAAVAEKKCRAYSRVPVEIESLGSDLLTKADPTHPGSQGQEETCEIHAADEHAARRLHPISELAEE